MTGEFFIDNRDIFTTFGVCVKEGGYDELLAFPALVEPDKNVWPEEDGIEVDLSAPVLSGKELAISFVATDPSIEINEFISYVARPGYRMVRIPALNREWRLRLVSQPDTIVYGPTGDQRIAFSLRFADDFPMRVLSYEPADGGGTQVPSSVYSLDGIALDRYGIVVESGRDNVMRSAAVKKNLTRQFSTMDGVLYDADHVAFTEKEVSFKCCLVADTVERFWKCYIAFFNDLIRPGERILRYGEIDKSYPCYYQSTSGWNLKELSDRVIVEFTLTLVFTAFRDSGNTIYLLATEEGDWISTEDDNLIDMSVIRSVPPTNYIASINTSLPEVPETQADDIEICKRRITEMPEAGSLKNLILPAVDRSTNRNVHVPVSRLGGSGGGGILSGTLGGLMNVDEKVDDTLDYGVVLTKIAGSDTWSMIPVADIAGGQQGIQRNVRIVNELDSKNVSASKGEPCPLIFTFVSQERYSVGEPYEDTGERGLCQISVKNSDMGDYVVMKQIYLNSGMPFTIDVAEYLSSGANNIMIKVTGEVTEETTPAFVYTVYLTSLSLSANNFKWWTAYTGNITLPLNIGGNVSKTLYVTLSGENYNESYEIPIGTGIYTETAYNYVVEHPQRSGVFKLSAYVTNSDGTIRTRAVSFQVICAVAGDAVKLVAINNLLPKATNWAENTLFDYAMYDGDNVSTSARFVIQKDDMAVFSSNEDSISTSTRHTFALPLEIETLDNAEFQIAAHIMDGEEELTPPVLFAVNNSLGYSATAGSVFYMNPKTRSNRQENYREILNETATTTIPAVWTGMNWGNDGWVSDNDGNKTLRLMAGSSLTIDYKPFKKECARTGKTIEIDYRVDNVTDYTTPVLTIASPSGDSFVGLKIYADELVMHSQSLRNSKIQGIHTHEGKRIRMTLVIMPDAYGNSDFNLCILYINGKKNREFTYENNDYFAHDGNIVIGSDYADIDIYGLRIYDSALTSPAVLRNYINWMISTTDKAKISEENDVLDSNGSEVDFENTKDQYNVLVFDNTIPRMADPSARTGTLEVYFSENPERNVTISNVQVKGQGTSSMKYYLWNTRYSIDKEKSVITYADGTTGKKTWQMVPSIPASAKFTAKKNYASSMQSHKMGSANSVHDLYRQLGLSNEAMRTEKYKDIRVSVYQLPFVCFEKSINEDGETVYTFMGEYTFGPDKGDKYCFGYDTDLFPGLISIEGSDNSPLLTLFRVPWTDSCVKYNADEEAFQYNNANAWDFDGGLEENISLFVPAYNLAYSCSDRLHPFKGTVEELNAQVATMRNQPFEFWIAKANDPHQYDVYYYESGQNRFIPSDIGDGTINLVSQLVNKGYGLTSADLTAKTAEELNVLFINARISKFRKEAPAYWDIDDAILHRNWVEMHAGTDQRAKNTYCYCFGKGCKWKWRYDDMDTIFDTDNEGQPEKPYGVEIHDTNETGAAVWNGETSNFWNLLDLAFPEEVVTGMRNMLSAMEELGGLKSGTDFDKIFAYYQKYYFAPAQEYFPANIVNADAKIAYEQGKLAYMKGSYTNDTDPITQSLGDHYSAETRWVTKRIIYMMSKYSFGLFSANGTDSITVRAAGNTIKYELTPAMDLYPAIANGTSIIRGNRTKAGEKCEMLIELSGSGDQQNTIQGASYLQDIGDWHEKNVQGSMIIQGRMLREIRLGSKTETVGISITTLTLSNCMSLEKLLLSNISTLTGTLNLSTCTRLKEIHTDGTALTQLKLPEGGSLRLIEYSSKNQYISLSNYPYLTRENVNINQCAGIVTDLFIVNCPTVGPMSILARILNEQANQGQSHALHHVRIVGFTETYGNADILDDLMRMADGTYKGLSSTGVAGEDTLPILEGKLIVDDYASPESVPTLNASFPKLDISVKGLCIRFADKEVLRICIERYDLDGNGVITAEEAEYIGADQFQNYFQGNTRMESFDELRYFKNASPMYDGTFRGCSSLKRITLPDSWTKIKYREYYGTALEQITLPNTLVEIGGQCFMEVKTLKSIALPQSLEALVNGCFCKSGLETADIPSNVTNIDSGIFESCSSLRKVIIRCNILKSIGGIKVFYQCISLKEIIITRLLTPPALGWGTFEGTTCSFYVPDEAVTAYKNATGWSNMASRIYPLSTYSGAY